jgi:hypothetical protein
MRQLADLVSKAKHSLQRRRESGILAGRVQVLLVAKFTVL